MSTKIQWTDDPLNIVVGCDEVSPGCRHCYAAGIAHRGMQPAHKGLTIVKSNGVQWNGSVRLVPERLTVPLTWKKPRRVFVCSMSDLFHRDVPFSYIAAAFAVFAKAREHTFQVLTKRDMRPFFAWLRDDPRGALLRGAAEYGVHLDLHPAKQPWPLSNVWLGTSCENQRWYEARIDALLACPAAVRFLSCEPLLGPIDLGLERNPSIKARLHWVIVGGESGPKARPCALEWVESIVEQCARAKVACFVKQLGSMVVSEERAADTVEEARAMLGDHVRHRWLWCAGLADSQGGDPAEWPEDLRVRQFPEEGRAAVR